MEQDLKPIFEENELLNSNCNTPKKEERELHYNDKDNKSVIIQDGVAEAPLLVVGENLETFLCCSPNKIVTETTICDDLLNPQYLLPTAEEHDLRDVTMVASTETTRARKPRESLLEEEIADLKLQLNASQQDRASLEIIIISLAEAMQKEAKQLKENLECLEKYHSQLLTDMQEIVKDFRAVGKHLNEVFKRMTNTI